MNAQEILSDLTERGFSLKSSGDGQLVISPKLTEADRERVKRFKPEILSLLEQVANLAKTSPVDWPENLASCPVCGSVLRKREAKDDWHYQECLGDPTHFAQLLNRHKDGSPMGYFLPRSESEPCSDCGRVVVTLASRCSDCWAMCCLIFPQTCGHSFSYWRLKDTPPDQDVSWHCVGCSLPPSDKPFVVYSE